MAKQQNDFEKTLGYALHHSAFLMKLALKQIFKQSNFEHSESITPESFFLLNMIPVEGIEQQLLVIKTRKDKAAITRLLDGLTRHKWIIRRVDKNNKRKVTVKISPEGLKLKETLNKILAELSQSFTKDIPSQDLQVTYKVLNRLTENLDIINKKLHD